MEKHDIKRYVRDFGIEFKNGSWIRVVTPSEGIRSRRYESVFYSDECAGISYDEIRKEFSVFETRRPSWHWKTVAPSWCEELSVYSVPDLGEMEMDTIDISALFG